MVRYTINGVFTFSGLLVWFCLPIFSKFWIEVEMNLGWEETDEDADESVFEITRYILYISGKSQLDIISKLEVRTLNNFIES